MGEFDVTAKAIGGAVGNLVAVLDSANKKMSADLLKDVAQFDVEARKELRTTMAILGVSVRCRWWFASSPSSESPDRCNR